MMLTWIRQFLAAPVFEDEDKTRVASMLNTILLTVLALAVTYSIFSLIAYPNPVPRLAMIGVVVLLVLGALFLMHHGRVQSASMLFSSMLWVIVTLIAIVSGGVLTTGSLSYIAVILVAGLLLGGRAGIRLAALTVLAGLGILYAEINDVLPPPLIPSTPITMWVGLAANLILAAVVLHLATASISDSLERARRYAVELEEHRGRLGETVEERTRDLVRRAHYLEATSEVARDAASVLDLQALLGRVVTLVSEQFGLYHTGIFLLDERGEYAVLRAASSEGGQKMLARGHQLRVGEVGIVGYVAASGRPRIALDVGADAVYFDNPDLPETRSEMALPLRARGEIIGALDVQSAEPEAFSDEDVAVLQTLADQVAMAISNARLFQQAQESLEAERRAYGELSRETWRELLRAQPALGFRRDRHGFSPAGDLWRPQMKAALQTGEITPGDGDGRTLAIPIKVRGQVIGVIDAHKPSEAGEWTAEEVALMETLTDQLGVALESARLYQDTQRRAARERLTGEVTARMRETLDMETVLKTAVQEVQEALGLPEVIVRLTTQPIGQAGDDVETK
jgi:GAF domain-containing protein